MPNWPLVESVAVLMLQSLTRLTDGVKAVTSSACSWLHGSRNGELSCRLDLAGDGVEIDKHCAVASPPDEIADQFDDTKVRVVGVENRRVGEEVEHGPVFNVPFDSQPDGAQEIVEFPAAVTKRANVADR